MFYHGTTDKFLEKILNSGLLPANVTGNKCENRQVNLDKVFLTKERYYAEGYALRAVIKHGGQPIILKVEAKAVLERSGKIEQWVSPIAKMIGLEEVEVTSTTYDALVTRMVAIFNNLPHRQDRFPQMRKGYGT